MNKITLDDFYDAKQMVDKIIKKTPLIYSDFYSQEYDADIYLKPENLQRTGAFKIRGAYNKIIRLTEEEKKERVDCFKCRQSCAGSCPGGKGLWCESHHCYAFKHPFN